MLQSSSHLIFKHRERGSRKRDMEVNMKVAAVYIRKYLLFSLEFTYKITCEHPVVASFVFSLFLLHSCYPFLFAFLVSSSPVLICTALLLGILLCYGDPYIPEIEEEDKLNLNVSSSKVQNSLDDQFVKKDVSYISEGHLDSRVGTRGMTFEDSSADGQNERVGDFLALSSSVDEQNRTGEDYIFEHGYVENVGVLLNEQSECHVRRNEGTNGGSEGVEGLMLRINRSELDECIDSSLGSPWQHVHILDAASDSESDRAESSSSDDSMADILPMLSELHPLLDSKAPKSADNSDADLSQHHEFDEDSVEQEDEHRIEENDASNKVVTWTADDQKNVMDLGSSDLERNRRLESLIARRRARKNQIIIFEQDLIDLHSNDTVDELFRFHPQIPHIFAPRRNPFDLNYESEESKGYPPIPGSAPSVLVHRQNPFDFPRDSENDSVGLPGDNVGQPEFELPSRRGFSLRRHESFASRSLFPSNVMDEKHGSSSSSRFKPCFVNETIGLECNEHADSDTVSSPIDPKNQKELAEHEMYDDTELPISIHDTITAVQEGQSNRDDLVDFDRELVEDGHFVDSNLSAVTEETHRNIDASGRQFVSLMIDGQNHEVVEERHDEWTLFTSSEDKDNISLHEALETLGQITSFLEETIESMQPSEAYDIHLFCETERVYDSEAAVPVYDSSPSGSVNFISNNYVPEKTLPSSGNSTSMESYVQDDVIELDSHARAFGENVTSDMREFEMVHELQNSKSSNGEPVIFSTYMNLLDEDMLKTKVISERGEQPENPEHEEFCDIATSLEIDHSSSFSSREADLNRTGFVFSAGLPKSDVEDKHHSLGNFEMPAPSETCNFELGPIPEENSEDFMAKEKGLSSVLSTVMPSTRQRVLEEPNVSKSSVVQVFSLHNQSDEATGDEDKEKEVAFSPENVKPSKTSDLVSPKDDQLSGLMIGEFSDAMEFSNLYKIETEYEFKSIDGINNSQASDIDEFQINQDVTLRKLNEFYAEPGDEDAEAREIQFFDESLLSELDTVGDFHVRFESQQFHRTEPQSVNQLDCRIEDSELRSTDIADTSPKKPILANPNNPLEMDLALNQKETVDSGFWSLSMAPVEDLELTVYKSKFNVLQACSLEELNSTFKQDPHGEFTEPSLSETITDNFVAEKPHVGLGRFDTFDEEIDAIPCTTTLLTEKIVEDVNSDLIGDGRYFSNPPPAHVYFQLNDNHSSVDACKAELTTVDACENDPTETQSLEIKAVHVEADIPSTSGLTSYISALDEAEASSTELDISSRDLKREEADSEVFVVKAKMIEDTDSVFKHPSEIILMSPPVNPNTMMTQIADNIVEAMSHEVEKTSGLLFLEANSAEVINSSFNEATEGGPATPGFCFSDPESLRTHTDYEEVELNPPDVETLSELSVLEVKSAEEMQLAFKQPIGGVSATSTYPLVDPDLIKAAQGLEIEQAVYTDVHDNSELLVPDEELLEDIDYALKPFYVEKMGTHSNIKLEADETGSVSLENDTNYTEPFTLGKQFVAVSSASKQATNQVYNKPAFHQVHTMSFGSRLSNEVVDVYSLETQIGQELSVLDTKSAEGINLKAEEQDNEECPVHPTSQDALDLLYLHPGLDPLKNESLRAEDKSEIFGLEAESFEEPHLNFKEAAATSFCQSTTNLIDPEHNPEQVVLDEQSPNSDDNLAFLAAEAKSLEGLNLVSEQAAKDYLAKPTSKNDADYDAVKESCFAADNYSELIVVGAKTSVNMQSPFLEATAGVCEVSSSSINPRPIVIHPGEKNDDNICSEAENNSEILLIEAKCLDDINYAFKLAINVPSSSLLTGPRSLGTGSATSLFDLEEGSTKPIVSNDPPAVPGTRDDEFMEDISFRKNDMELLFLEEESVEVMDSTSEHVSEEHLGRSVTLEDDSKPETPLALQQKDSELFVLEPINDNDAIFKQDSKTTAFSESEEGSAEGINQEKDEHDYATTGGDTEVEHAKETTVVSDEIAVSKNVTNVDQMNKKTDEEESLSESKEEIFSENPGASAPTSLNRKKKKKRSEKSDSSSSSSSSSSDTE